MGREGWVDLGGLGWEAGYDQSTLYAILKELIKKRKQEKTVQDYAR